MYFAFASMRRLELRDEQWSKIADLFATNRSKRGRQGKDHRRVLNGRFGVLCSGAPWRDLPKCYRSWQTVHDRFRRYRIESFLDVLLGWLQLEHNPQVLIDFGHWEVDSTIIRANKSAAGTGLKKGIRKGRASLPTMQWVAAGAVCTKIHWLSDSRSLSLATLLNGEATQDAAFFTQS